MLFLGKDAWPRASASRSVEYVLDLWDLDRAPADVGLTRCVLRRDDDPFRRWGRSVSRTRCSINEFAAPP